MATITLDYFCDLKKAVKVQYVDGMAFSGDNGGNTINVFVMDGDNPAAISGDVVADVIRSDGGTVAVTGAIEGNKAYIILPAACYSVPGVISIVIKISQGTTIATICALVANVYRSSTDAIIDPGTILPSIQSLITQINTAVASIPADYSALWETLAPAFSTDTSYVAGQYVTYDGDLYRFLTTHSGAWSATDVIAVSVGGDLYDSEINFNTLRGSITDADVVSWADAGTESYPNGWAKGYYNADTGAPTTANLYIRSNSTYYFREEEATLMELIAPPGYMVCAYEYKPDGTYVGKHGSITDQSVGNHVFFEFEKGNKFRFAIGKFNNEADSIAHYSDDGFLASFKAVFYALKSETLADELYKQIGEINTNLDAIFYTEKIEYAGSNWRTGYYDHNTGNYLTSNKYICTASTVVISRPNATRLSLEAPDGYYIKAFEYTSGDVFVEAYGSFIATNRLDIAFTEGHKFRLAVGPFPNKDAGDHLTDAFIGQIKVSLDEIKIMDQNTKLDKTGDYEWFSVTVDRPLAFGGEEVIDETEEQEIECVLRLPTTYTKQETPTRLILACHGASGYVRSSTSTWYNANWKAFMDELLAAGYAVFDANVLPSSTGTDQMGFAVGSPYYVNVLKKAYDYIVYNYNVYPEIFAHGTSMGGVGATAFAHAYPEIVLAESSFAGRNILRYLYYISIDDLEKATEFAAAWGYESFADLMTDKFSHIDGCFPDLSIINYASGDMQTPPDREADFTGWLEYFGQIANLAADANPGVWTGHRVVPYKAWNSWADSAQYTKLIEVLAKVYNRGNACQFYSVAYETGTHTEMSYGQINDMRDQLIAWYKRWE